jgi:hypothetical protein
MSSISLGYTAGQFTQGLNVINLCAMNIESKSFDIDGTNITIETYNNIKFIGDTNKQTINQLLNQIKYCEKRLLALTKPKVINYSAEEFMYFDIPYTNFKTEGLDSVYNLKPIVVTVSSYCGEMNDVYYLLDAIQNLNIDIHTVISGFCDNGGALLALIGKKRFITKKGRIRLRPDVKQYCIDELGISSENVLFNKDILNAKDCIELGLAELVN